MNLFTRILKKLFTLLLFVMAFAVTYGQGFETFDNFPATGSSYQNGTFMGQDGSEWTYTQCRGDVGFTGKAIMIGRNRTPQSNFYSGNIPNGIGVLSFDYMQTFSTNVNLNVLINDVVVGNVTSNGEQNIIKNSGDITIHVEGDIVIKFIGYDNSSGQVVIDNVAWSSYEEIGNPPTNFSASFNQSMGVVCNWEPPIVNDDVLHYDDGVNVAGIGLDGGGTFAGAIKFTSTQLADYEDWYLTSVRFFPSLFATPASCTLKIWEGEGAENLVYQQAVNSINWDEWNEIPLNQAHVIDATTSLWFGFEFTHVPAEYPLGHDTGPASIGFGDLIFYTGQWWSLKDDFGIDVNWNIQGLVAEQSLIAAGKKEIIAQDGGSKRRPEIVTKKNEPKHLFNFPEDLIGFNVYRNDTKVNAQPILDLTFTDPFFTQGTYTYNARAIYTEGLSEASNAVVVEIPQTGLPQLQVSPLALHEVHDNPPQVTNKTLTLSNTGDAPLVWQMATSTITFKGGETENWNTPTPTSGTIQPGLSQPVSFQFNSTDLMPGLYQDAFQILSNDPASPQVTVPVSLTVQQYNPPVADFTGDPLEGTAPLMVSFSDLSSGNIVYREWDLDGDGQIDSWDVNPTYEYDLPGSYTVSLTVIDGYGNSSTETRPDYVTVEQSQTVWFDPVWESPYLPMTFYIVEATIDELPMQPGDEVGLFDIDPINGDEICVGAGVLVEELGGGLYLEIIASMDDASNPDAANGFTPGNAIIYKLWNELTEEITTVTALYPYPGYDEVYTSQGSALVEVHGVTSIMHCVDFSAGWNIMSYRAMPENADMLAVVQPLIDVNALFKILDEAGGSVFYLPFPPPNGQWSNTIGDMQETEGYYIKVNQPIELCVEGMPVETPLEIPLSAGWNIISYPCETPQNALTVLQPLIDDGLLFKAIDQAGGSVFFLPFPPPNGQWSNTIGNLQAGQGYYVKVNAATTLTIACPEGAEGETAYRPEALETVYFETAFQNNPYMPMHVALLPGESLEAGDEVGVFDGSLCVGAAVYDGNPEMPLVITLSMDDPDEAQPTGFMQGNEISVKIWSAQTGMVQQADYEFLSGVETFAPLETMIGELMPLLTKTDGFYDDAVSLQVLPNPFSQQTTIVMMLAEFGDVELQIRTLSGNLIQSEAYKNVQRGRQNIVLNANDIKSGVYLLHVKMTNEKGSREYVRKLIKL
jgi:PKD repeat protein